MYNTPALGSAPIGSSPFGGAINKPMGFHQGNAAYQPARSPFASKPGSQPMYAGQHGGLASILGYGNMAADTAAGSTPATAPTTTTTPTTPAPVIPKQPSYVPAGNVLQGDAFVPVPGYIPPQPALTPEQFKLMALLGSDWMNGTGMGR